MVVAHFFNPSTREAEAGKSLCIQDQPGLQELVPGQAPKIWGKSASTKTNEPNSKDVWKSLKKPHYTPKIHVNWCMCMYVCVHICTLYILCTHILFMLYTQRNIHTLLMKIFHLSRPQEPL